MPRALRGGQFPPSFSHDQRTTPTPQGDHLRRPLVSVTTLFFIGVPHEWGPINHLVVSTPPGALIPHLTSPADHP